MKYVIQNRYEGEGWEFIQTKVDKDIALRLAETYAKDAISYGMVRVIDTELNEILITYPAGGKTEDQLTIQRLSDKIADLEFELSECINNELMLQALDEAGVDHWVGHSEAMKIYKELVK